MFGTVVQTVVAATPLSVLAGSSTVSAQKDTFEVASVRPFDPKGPGGFQVIDAPCSGGFDLTAGRISITGAPVSRLFATGQPQGEVVHIGLVTLDERHIAVVHPLVN
jgi:hypothetical protein